jgi:hypothetical protein
LDGLRNRIVAFPIFEAVLLVTSLIILPMSSPVLQPASWVRYTTALHLHGDKMETAATGSLPQFYADRFGWQQEVSVVLNTFRSLSPQDQRRVCIFGSNYGGRTRFPPSRPGCGAAPAPAASDKRS